MGIYTSFTHQTYQSHTQAWIWNNTLAPRHISRYFEDDISKFSFMNENIWSAIKISLKFDLRSPINNISALVRIKALIRRQANIWTNVDPVQWRIYATLGVDEGILDLTRYRFRVLCAKVLYWQNIHIFHKFTYWWQHLSLYTSVACIEDICVDAIDLALGINLQYFLILWLFWKSLKDLIPLQRQVTQVIYYGQC